MARFEKPETDPVASAAVTAESAARASADMALDGRVDTLEAIDMSAYMVQPDASFPVVAFGWPGFNVKKQNTLGRPMFVMFQMGVVSGPGENGHIYLEVAPNNNGGAAPADSAFARVAVVACRNNQADAGEIGAGGTLFAMVAAGAWFRVTTLTIVGWQTPEFVMIESPVFTSL